MNQEPVAYIYERPNGSSKLVWVREPHDKDIIKEVPLYSGETLANYKRVLEEIANDYPELSYDKARMQNLDHIKWAKEVLK